MVKLRNNCQIFIEITSARQNQNIFFFFCGAKQSQILPGKQEPGTAGQQSTWSAKPVQLERKLLVMLPHLQKKGNPVSLTFAAASIARVVRVRAAW